MGLRALAIAYLENVSKSHSNNCPTVRMPSGRPDRTARLAEPQVEADKRNTVAKREGSTFRYCRCGDYAECAWPLDGRREVWRCFQCIETAGKA